MDAMKAGLRKYFNTCQTKLHKTLRQNCELRIRILKPKNEHIIMKKRHIGQKCGKIYRFKAKWKAKM